MLTRGIDTGAAAVALESDSAIAAQVRQLLATGDVTGAHDRFADLVDRQQRRANRLAFLYLRDAGDADEAVQDAFLKAFTNLASFREDLPFEAWFTRILINGCLDRLKARTRRERWFVPLPDGADGHPEIALAARSRSRSPEELLVGREAAARVMRALSKLPERQRAIFVLTHFDERTSREVSALTGLSESTVRVHLFRALKKLRALLRPSDGAGDADRSARQNVPAFQGGE